MSSAPKVAARLDGHPRRVAPLAKAVTRVAEKRPVVVPPSLAAALARHPAAQSVFDGFSPSHRREYVEWIAQAKTQQTRDRRVEKALEQMVAGKVRHSKSANPGE